MCYSAQSSISNYIYTTTVSLILYLYGDKYDKHISLFTFVVIQMQLAEYFMWKDQKCGITNKLATIAARFILFLQPLSIFLGAYLFDTMNISNNTMIIISVIYTFSFVINLINYLLKNKKICSLDKDGHLQWHFFENKDYKALPLTYILNIIQRIVYFAIFLFSWLLFYNTNLGIFFSLLTIIIFLFHYIQFPKNYQWTTLWCYHISIGITIYAIVRYFDYKYKIF